MSETTTNKPPRRITDEFVATCAHCSQVAYVEKVVADYSGEVPSYRRFVAGSYQQECAPDGTPTGPVVPHCPNCNAED